MKKTSLVDIANHLGVSKTLVSFVLNGKAKEFRINDEVCQKVLDAARELNYQPNRIAQGLRTGKTHTIGLIIADIANPFFGKLGREIELEAEKNGYRVIFCSTDEDPEKAGKLIAMLQQSLVDGFIISPPVNSEKHIRKLVDSKAPIVLIDRHFPSVGCNHVIVDNFEAAYNATKYLIGLGRKRISNMTLNLGLENMKERTEGYRMAMIDSGLAVEDGLITVLPFNHSSSDIENALKNLLGVNNGNPKTDAILFSTSKIGVLAIECIRSMGLKIPEDVAVISFDNADAYKICVSPVTVISQPLREIGRASVNLLLDEIQNPNQKIQHIKLKTEFIVRKSCGT